MLQRLYNNIILLYFLLSIGYGGLSLSIEGPSKAEIQCKDNEDGTLNISYRPTEPGYYIVNLKFADHHVDGSPFTVKVTGEGSNCQREKIERRREAVPLTEVGSNCKLTFKMPGKLALYYVSLKTFGFINGYRYFNFKNILTQPTVNYSLTRSILNYWNDWLVTCGVYFNATKSKILIENVYDKHKLFHVFY